MWTIQENRGSLFSVLSSSEFEKVFFFPKNWDHFLIHKGIVHTSLTGFGKHVFHWTAVITDPAMLQWPNWMLAISVSRRSEVRVSCSLQDCHDDIFLCIHNAVWIWLCSHMCVFTWPDAEMIYLGYLSCFCIACVCVCVPVPRSWVHLQYAFLQVCVSMLAA